MKRSRNWILLAVLLLGVGPLLEIPVQGAPPEDCSIRLVDVTANSGIRFRHTDGGSGQRYIVESVVAGLALFDYDGDGLIDIYFLNGAALKGTVVDAAPRHALYRNHGNWTFSDVTEQAGVADHGYGLGVTVADYDDDGDPDLYLNNFGPKALYRNNGDGTFTNVTDQVGLTCQTKVGAGACFLDLEGDGDLDLYSANYIDFSYDKHVIRKIGEHQFHPGPKDYRPVADDLFRNEGDGTFRDVTMSSGIGSVAGPGMGTICFDFDEDGDSDIFVCNDSAPNFLFQNDGTGRFQESGLLAGVAYNGVGNVLSSMGADCGDYDGDGHLDLFVTAFSDESPVLFRNLGRGLFEDTTNSARAGYSSHPHAKWGTSFVDLDHDGDLDLFIACGHFMDNIQHIDDRTAVKVRNVLLMNTGDKRFVDVSDRCGNGLAAVESSRGAAFDDLDNDGDIDAVVLNANSQPTVLRNETTTGNHWVQVRLKGSSSNRDGVGSRVRITAGGRTQVSAVHSGRGYQSHYGTTLHFGLGSANRVERVEIHWPNLTGEERIVEERRALTADRKWLLHESASR